LKSDGRQLSGTGSGSFPVAPMFGMNCYGNRELVYTKM